MNEFEGLNFSVEKPIDSGGICARWHAIEACRIVNDGRPHKALPSLFGSYGLEVNYDDRGPRGRERGKAR